ncbi:TetR/AcrR family transcriptional regulator [Bacillus sp. DTU_2020_1000418_1_SI_GHA_SEK_038]|uniref:TetR/AcrR family transcriptional regulator n=1 Tax=Bacillus sp. DTU_2020_1000418_1_SI_GHA_SEK_038 TaxID=3077585 RepID=UPI0028E65A57|nr:TetR/AcrR family transcriptional regulator [Bacillus sp. DTU_2020_1000418_1_SI_GHA_SEK_038]WNS77678.1 TetR/AcrR family transcriptional regulator [Bacillus sp. DTU_2020_1000418_1_SI_GHA_SEK_038]
MFEQDSLITQLFDDEKELTDKQKKIILAAIDSFSEKGYAATSTSEIAKKAGVAEGTIFRHYKTKKDLLLGIVAPTMAKLLAPFVIKDLYKVLDTKYENFEDFLRAMIENRVAFAKKNMPLLKILIQEIPFHPELKEQFFEHIAKKVFERYVKVTEHYQEKGQIIDIPPQQVIRLTVTTIMGYLIGRYILFPDATWNDEEEIELTIKFLMRGLAPN